MDTRKQLRINELSIKLSEGTIAHEEIAELERLLDNNPEAIEYYIDCSIDLNQFHELLSRKTAGVQKAPLSENDVLSDSAVDNYLWQELLRQEKTAPTVHLPRRKEKSQKELIQSLAKVNVPYTFKKSSLIPIIASAAAILFVVLFARFAPEKTGFQVATLNDTMDARWADMDGAMKNGTRLTTGSDNLMLREGYAELLFDNNARLTIEAPAEFQILTSDQIKLNYGRLYAVIPEQAYGFTVCTNYTKIIDLGTEFGVQEDTFGNTELHVIKGKTSLVSRLQGNKINIEVTENSAKQLTWQTGQIQDIPTDTRLFARDINSQANIVWKGQKSIDLADIVGGGKGFGEGTIGCGIDQRTGEITSEQMTEIRTATNQYLPVKDSPLIDGIFVPDSGNGPVVISSQGHLFEECPDTNGKFWGGIFNGAQHEAIPLGIPRHDLRLGSKSYASNNPSSIYIHANQGITFDLQVVRQMIAGTSVYRFTAVCGISNTLNDYKDTLKAWTAASKWVKLNPESSTADFYVLVDGKIRFAKTQMTVQDGAVEVSVDIHPGDRFLTLVTTQGSDEWDNTNDWTLFGEPKLLINP